MVVLYPESLPQFPQISGYTEQLQDNLIRNTTGVGPPKTRPRSTAPRKTVSFPITLTQTQKDILDTFFKTNLSFGTSEFQLHLPDDSGTEAIYKFLKPPAFRSIGGDKWSVTLQLEIIREV
ncbi:hypothetical protein LCGC14_1540110 [marine sediment metagenome]|uniref:Uncharacterized protein n=1 Tax=marine sediment metagenome TaxID=412755 RepID=A0A0F9ITF1_9ZZZZ